MQEQNYCDIKYQYLIENTPAVIYTCVASGDFKITYMSKNVERLLGFTDVEVLEDPDFWFNHIHPEDRDEIFKVLPKLWQLGQQEHEYRFLTKDDNYIWMLDTLRLSYDSNNEPLEIVGSLLNITMRKELEEEISNEKKEQEKLINKLKHAKNQLVKSEKMASLGQLAAGVAHEINNPVGFIMSNLSTLNEYSKLYQKIIGLYEKSTSTAANDSSIKLLDHIQKIKEDDDIEFVIEDTQVLIDESLEGAERVRDIVHQLKCFSHVDENKVSSASINEILDNTIKVVWNEVKYKAEIEKDYGDVPKIDCVASELNQVFMNMLVNAAHAIKDRGIITVKTKQIGEDVLVSIKDTGQGIKPENLKKLFDPFFTTKPVGQGTGLGLSISYGIIESHNGEIEVNSEIGQGTEFRIRLPIKNNQAPESEES